MSRNSTNALKIQWHVPDLRQHTKPTWKDIAEEGEEKEVHQLDHVATLIKYWENQKTDHGALLKKAMQEIVSLKDRVSRLESDTPPSFSGDTTPDFFSLWIADPENTKKFSGKHIALSTTDGELIASGNDFSSVLKEITKLGKTESVEISLVPEWAGSK